MTRIYRGQAQIESLDTYFIDAIGLARSAAGWLQPRNRNTLLDPTSADSAIVRTALTTYFGVQFGPGPVPAMSQGDTTFVDTLQTVYAAMATALNTWTVYVEYADWDEHDAGEYAAAGPPVVFPGPDGEVDPANPNSFQATWADVRNNINRGTQSYVFMHNGVPLTVSPARDLAFKIQLNVRFRNADDELKQETILHEMSHALADTNDAAYADTIVQARQICAAHGAPTARDTADCWGFFPFDI
ncbi:hypothetical protein [Marilutibacter alkalisoli]|uniref:Lysine-specific metallo-endopeptidase domain-containing protein n=1 Tax=Marilutibacter alkalisoli TaxID=2591633 RepID=A0A514BSD8_9GAMM|nr:hypothetical protein [Lysobacter alkalisoli]QDH70294.1 hypothetical protein FKV23_09490 [Lysobacter alkalisoli]